MKRFFYGMLIVMATMSVFTSCTEEEVKPKTEVDANAGGGDPGEVLKK
jgi:hypothetical protein